jgi:hypothetical protein
MKAWAFCKVAYTTQVVPRLKFESVSEQRQPLVGEVSANFCGAQPRLLKCSMLPLFAPII